jgi:hypothetical protein
LSRRVTRRARLKASMPARGVTRNQFSSGRSRRARLIIGVGSSRSPRPIKCSTSGVKGWSSGR